MAYKLTLIEKANVVATYVYMRTNMQLTFPFTSRPQNRPPKTKNPLRLLSSEGFSVLVVIPADQISNLDLEELKILAALRRLLNPKAK